MKLNDIGEMLLEHQKDGRVALISDSNVAPLYMEECKESLKKAGFKATAIVIPAGEESKNGDVYLRLLEDLAEIPLTRADSVVSLGGGVVGDLAGFAAATYMRGIRIVQVPTTLLAMVDSSIGGKTAINLKNGKNLAGAFHMPAFVLTDYALLDTLPEEVFKEGMAEVIKYGVIEGRELLEEIRAAAKVIPGAVNKGELISSVAERCAEIKRKIVKADEFDRGERMILNLGHTVGHALEKLSDYKLPHGFAVAKGIRAIADISCKAGWCSEETRTEIMNVLTEWGFDLEILYDKDDIIEAIRKDKKRTGNHLDLIIPEEIGKCVVKRINIENEANKYFIF